MTTAVCCSFPSRKSKSQDRSGGGVKINGSMEMKRAKQNARLYSVHFNYTVGDDADEVEAVYQVP